MNHHREGLLSIHAAVLILGFTALFSKFIDLNAVDITFIRSIFAVIAIIFYIKMLRQSILLSSVKDYVIIFIIGFFLATHWITYFHAMQVSSVAIGIIALYTYPVITVFLEPLFHGARPHSKDVFSALIVLFGIYLLVPEFSIDNQTTQGVMWGILSAILFSLRNIIQGHYFKQHSAKHSLLYQGLLVVILLAPFSAQNIPQISQHQWLLLAILGVFFTALPHTLFANSLRYLKAKSVSLIACTQVVYGTLFAALLLAEVPNWSTIIGGTIVVSAAAYETITTAKQ